MDLIRLAEVMMSPSWPLVLLAIAAMFRPQIAQALAHLRAFRGPGGWEGKFDAQKSRKER